MPEVKPKKTVLNIFTCLGVDISPKDEEMAYGTCPFCDKSNHLYVRYAGKKLNSSTGKWSVPGHWYCQACTLHGGIPRFLTEFISASKATTTKEDRKELWTKKRIPPAAARTLDVCRSILTGDWLIPTYAPEGKHVSNIHRWWEAKNKLLGCDTLLADLLGRQFLSTDNTKPLWLAEGHWDWIILEHLYRAADLRDSYDILGVPGCGSFQHDWLSLLENRPEVVILFDNDHIKTLKTGKTIQPGLDGVKRIANMVDEMDNKPERVRYVKWPDDYPDGFDLRDLYTSHYNER